MKELAAPDPGAASSQKREQLPTWELQTLQLPIWSCRATATPRSGVAGLVTGFQSESGEYFDEEEEEGKKKKEKEKRGKEKRKRKIRRKNWLGVVWLDERD